MSHPSHLKSTQIVRLKPSRAKRNRRSAETANSDQVVVCGITAVIWEFGAAMTDTGSKQPHMLQDMSGNKFGSCMPHVEQDTQRVRCDAHGTFLRHHMHMFTIVAHRGWFVSADNRHGSRCVHTRTATLWLHCHLVYIWPASIHNTCVCMCARETCGYLWTSFPTTVGCKIAGNTFCDDWPVRRTVFFKLFLAAALVRLLARLLIVVWGWQASAIRSPSRGKTSRVQLWAIYVVELGRGAARCLEGTSLGSLLRCVRSELIV